MITAWTKREQGEQRIARPADHVEQFRRWGGRVGPPDHQIAHKLHREEADGACDHDIFEPARTHEQAQARVGIRTTLASATATSAMQTGPEMMRPA